MFTTHAELSFYNPLCTALVRIVVTVGQKQDAITPFFFLPVVTRWVWSLVDQRELTVQDQIYY